MSHNPFLPHPRIEIGGGCQPLSSQLRRFGIPKAKLKMFDSLNFSLGQCFVLGVLSEREHTSACKRLITLCQDEITLAAILANKP